MLFECTLSVPYCCIVDFDLLCVCVNVDFAKQEWIPWGLSDEKSVMSKNVWEHLAVFVLILFEYACICLFSQEKIKILGNSRSTRLKPRLNQKF